MVLLELFLSALLYPMTRSALALATAAAVRGDSRACGRWLGVWRVVHAPVELCAHAAGYSYVRKASALEQRLSRALWRYAWYRATVAYCVANPFPFTERPWPSFIRNGTPFHAVEYYWFMYVAQDWASAQDALRDALACGWSVQDYKIERAQWTAEE